jgi:alkaline phosphatase D
VDRRRFLKHSGALVSALVIGRHLARAAGGHPFTLGVASGEPSSDGFVIWTRLAPAPLAPDGLGGIADPVPVMWEVASDDTMRRIVYSGTVEADNRLAHSVHVEVGGLEPARPYWYRFTALGQQSPIGRARTAPAPNARPDRMRFVIASCSHYELGYFSAYRHMAAEDPDLVLFLGDYIYEDTVPAAYADRTVRKHDGPAATDLVGYRNRYALYRTDPDLQALHASAPWLVTWDDHEVENDYANEWSHDMRVSSEDFLQRRAAAYQAYYEHMPLRARAMPQRAALRLYDRYRFGDLATFSVLDGRQYRSKQPCEVSPSRRGHVAPDACVERIDPQRSLLGYDQERWLFDGFQRNETAWNVLAQGQLVAQLRQKAETGEVGYWTDGATSIRSGQPTSRLTSTIRCRQPWPPNSSLPRSPQSPRLTSFSSSSFPRTRNMRYFESRHRGYVVVDLNRDRMETRFQVISERRDPAAIVSTLRKFVVESGKAGAVPV